MSVDDQAELDAASGVAQTEDGETTDGAAIIEETEPAALAVDGETGGRSDAPANMRGRTRRSRLPRFKRVTVVTHRWLSLVLGLILVIVTTSGAAVVFAPEWTRWTNSSTFETTKSEQPKTFQEAMEIVDTAHPEFQAGSINVYSGLYEVMSVDDDAHPGFYGVDPGSGRITGYDNPNSGFMAFMTQVHECFFTCDDYPGYVGFLNDHVPTLGMHWLKDMTWSTFILGIMGLSLVFLAVSGVWLWWPGIKKLARGFKVRTKKGRFARDYDLHQVIGMAALPFLFIWGFTGASFEFHWVDTAWYAATGGEQVPDATFSSKEVADANTPDITLDDAIAATRSKVSAGAILVYASVPAADDPTSYYDFWYSEKFDQYAHGAYPGQLEVEVDRHDATNVAVNDYGTAPTLSNKILDSLGPATLHYGQSFNGWWRIFWFAFGLSPLILMITALSTWFAKRGVKKRRKKVLAERASSTGVDPINADSVFADDDSDALVETTTT